MQVLEMRSTYTPTDAPQVCGPCDSVIKHGHCDQVLQKLKTVSNNSVVDQQSGKTGQDLRVPVLNMRGQPLMPTTPSKARHLLEKGKARVVSRKPFHIQLKYATGETVQPITLGIDTGYENIGVSAVSDKQELFSAEVNIKVPMKEQKKKNKNGKTIITWTYKGLYDRRMYRKKRRSRLPYRKPRFLNRGRKKGWLPPSIQHKLDTHIRVAEKLKKLLPITKIIVEVASFDIQKIENPDIQGVEYQQGEQLGFWNVREYVIHRDNHKCQHCKGKKKDPILQVHHINGKAEGATDRPEELLTVCKTCHDDHHSGKDIIPKKKIKDFKPETFMTIIYKRIVELLKVKFSDIEVKHTYGYITKNNRIKQKIPKSHSNDAFIIAGGTTQPQCKTIYSKPKRRNNRKLQINNRKGSKPSIRKQRYKFQSNDIVLYKGKEYRSKGMKNHGKYIYLDGLEEVEGRAYTKPENVKLVCYGKGLFA